MSGCYNMMLGSAAARGVTWLIVLAISMAVTNVASG